MREERQARLNRSVEPRYSDHTQVYEQYIAVVNSEDHPLPLKTHQAVLRACTPGLRDIRKYTAQSLQERTLDWHRLTHPYETRFEKIMRNIADAGFNPSIKDYHFVMSQFAAAGHYAGIQRYMRQMDTVGLEPTQGTFGFLLQAISHRISLPTSRLGRPAIVRELVGLTVETLREMFDRRIRPSSMSLDLAFRVLSEAYDLKGLAELLRAGYGVDLDYLDSPPMDAASVPSTSTAGSSPLSTNFLNSLLETLGRWGQISKMVYVFETLTNPLPTPAKTDDTYDDDEDDFTPIQQEWKPPSAEPNTTTFNTLIKHCVDHKYPALAEHYARRLMYEEHVITRRLRGELRVKPSSEVAAPRRAVTVSTLRPIHGFANRTHNIELLRWLIRACKLAVRRKYRSWTYYNQTKSKYLAPDTPAAPESPPSPSSSPSSLTPTSSSSGHSRPLTFNVITHLWVLRNDINELSDLKRKTAATLSDAITKCKARLGRRIWNGKDVYMRDKEARVNVDPEAWKGMVNFRESKRRVKPRPQVKKRSGGRFNSARSPRS